MTTQLTTQPTRDYSQFRIAITSDTKLSPRTQAKYLRELVHAENAGINLFDANELREYASGLKSSRRAFLSATVRRVTNEAIHQIKSNVTPDTLATAQATIMRMESLQGSVSTPAKKGAKSHTWLSVAEFKQLLALPDIMLHTGRRDKLALLLMGDCGLRRFEASQLTFKDVVRQGGVSVLEIAGKGDKTRRVPLSQAVLSLINEMKEAYGGNFVLKSFTKGGKCRDGLSDRSLANITKKYGAKIEHATLMPHDLRRTFAQIRYKAGVPVAEISKVLGHAKIDTTERYLQIDTGDLLGRDFLA